MNNLFKEILKNNNNMSCTCIARGDDKFKIATKKVISNLKIKMSDYDIEKITITIVSGTEIAGIEVEKIISLLKYEFNTEYEVKDVIHLHTMNDDVVITLSAHSIKGL